MGAIKWFKRRRKETNKIKILKRVIDTVPRCHLVTEIPDGDFCYANIYNDDLRVPCRFILDIEGGVYIFTSSYSNRCMKYGKLINYAYHKCNECKESKHGEDK